MFEFRLDELKAEIEMQQAFLRSMSELKKEHDAKMAGGLPQKVETELLFLMFRMFQTFIKS